MVFIIISLVLCSVIFGLTLHVAIEDNVGWGSVVFAFILLVIQVICLFRIIDVKKQEAIADFEAGKYKKEVLYKTRFVDDQPIIVDSLVTYTKRKETKTYILQWNNINYQTAINVVECAYISE